MLRPIAGTEVRARLLEDLCALVHLAQLPAVGCAPGGQRSHPLMQPLAAHAERIRLALVGAATKPSNEIAT